MTSITANGSSNTTWSKQLLYYVNQNSYMMLHHHRYKSLLKRKVSMHDLSVLITKKRKLNEKTEDSGQSISSTVYEYIEK